MLDEPRARKNGNLTSAAKGKAAGEADTRLARTLERAKAPHFAPTAPPPPSVGGLPNFRTVDRLSRALLARATHGISPAALAETWADWLLHLASAPGRRLELFQRAAMTTARFGLWLPGAAAGTKREAFVEPALGDRRFSDPAYNGRSTYSRKAFSRPKPGGGRRPGTCPVWRTTERPRSAS